MRVPHIFSASFFLLLVSPTNVTTPIEIFCCAVLCMLIISSYVHFKCEFCEKEDATQEHAVTCEEVARELSHSDVVVSLNENYDNLFQNS